VLLKLAERLGDVSGDGRLFRDDKCFAHVTWQILKLRCPSGATYFFFATK
jgi:hypothetical protein